MNPVTTLTSIPANSAITRGFGEVHFHDTYRIAKRTGKNVEEISKEIMKSPGWATALLRLRNSAVKIFGLKAGEAETAFPLISKSEDEIVSGVSDKHLDFRVSIMKDGAADTVSLTTVVHFNNVWGRVYFLPVRPFHKILMKVLMKRYSAIDD